MSMRCSILAQADGLRGHLHELVVADELDGLLQVQQHRRHQPDGFVGRGSAHVGELLLLDDVDVEVGGREFSPTIMPS
jgi:hypothetical protein